MKLQSLLSTMTIQLLVYKYISLEYLLYIVTSLFIIFMVGKGS